MGQWVLASTWAQLGTGRHAIDSQWEDKSLLFLILHVSGEEVGECVVCIFNICVSSAHGGFMSILCYAMLCYAMLCYAIPLFHPFYSFFLFLAVGHTIRRPSTHFSLNYPKGIITFPF